MAWSSISETICLYEYPLVLKYIPAPHQLRNQSLGSLLAHHLAYCSRGSSAMQGCVCFHDQEKACNAAETSSRTASVRSCAPEVFLDGHDIFEMQPRQLRHHNHVIPLLNHLGTDLSLCPSTCRQQGRHKPFGSSESLSNTESSTKYTFVRLHHNEACWCPLIQARCFEACIHKMVFRCSDNC